VTDFHSIKPRKEESIACENLPTRRKKRGTDEIGTSLSRGKERRFPACFSVMQTSDKHGGAHLRPRGEGKGRSLWSIAKVTLSHKKGVFFSSIEGERRGSLESRAEKRGDSRSPGKGGESRRTGNRGSRGGQAPRRFTLPEKVSPGGFVWGRGSCLPFITRGWGDLL